MLAGTELLGRVEGGDPEHRCREKACAVAEVGSFLRSTSRWQVRGWVQVYGWVSWGQPQDPNLLIPLFHRRK